MGCVPITHLINTQKYKNIKGLILLSPILNSNYTNNSNKIECKVDFINPEFLTLASDVNFINCPVLIIFIII